MTTPRTFGENRRLQSNSNVANFGMPATAAETDFLCVDIDQKRRKLSILYHAAHCRHEETGDCEKQRYCCAAKRVFQHMITCTHECDVPGCKKCRTIWAHYRKCTDRLCPLCTAVPAKYNSKNMCARFRKTSFTSAEDMSVFSTASPPSVGSMSVLSGRRNRRQRASATFGGKENTAAEVPSSRNRQQSLSAPKAENLGSKSRPPLSPRRPMWALF